MLLHEVTRSEWHTVCIFPKNIIIIIGLSNVYLTWLGRWIFWTLINIYLFLWVANFLLFDEFIIYSLLLISASQVPVISGWQTRWWARKVSMCSLDRVSVQSWLMRRRRSSTASSPGPKKWRLWSKRGLGRREIMEVYWLSSPTCTIHCLFI